MGFVISTLEKLTNKMEKYGKDIEQFNTTHARYTNAIETALKDLHNDSAETEYAQLKEEHEKLCEKVFGAKVTADEYTPSLLSVGRFLKKLKRLEPKIYADYEAFAKKYGINLN